MENKYGLNWRVWGNDDKKSSSEKTTPKILEGIGTGWSSPKPKNSQVECEEPVEQQVSEKKYTVRLKNAKFVPDETTDFNKPCKVTVEINSQEPPKGKVTFSLWSIYNDNKTDLHHETQEYAQNGVVESKLELYYDEKYYEDSYFNGKKDVTVDYFFKVNAKNAREIESEHLTMPRCAGKTCKMVFQDGNGNNLQGVNVTMGDGTVYTSNGQGEIEVVAPDGAETVSVEKIEMPV